jgi:uncharacterized membrane protein YraQ (UPF0718 family)
MEEIGKLALDTLYDSLKVLGFAFVIYVLLSFFEDKIAALLEKKKKWGPFFGSLSGAIPQCGISVVGADLYLKHHLTMGTLIAIFLSCSDEALPIFFSRFDGLWYMVFPLLGLKILAGTGVGYLVDSLNKRDENEVEEHLEHCEGNKDIHYGCCHHEIEQENPWHQHLVHPLLHSFKIFVYAYIVSFLFGLLIYYVGADNFNAFLLSNRYLSPLYAVVVGLIPNCASSVLLSELYLSGALPFGAVLAGLAVNAGLGPLYLFRKKENLKEAFLIMGILLVSSLALGYAFIWW